MSNKRQKKRPKKKYAGAAKQSLKARAEQVGREQVPSANARIIRDLMFTQNIKGNYKDYVVLAGKRLIDWQGSYDMVTEEGKTVGVQNMALVHKSKLHKIVGEQLASHFWRRGIGRINTEKSKGGGDASKQG